MAGTNEFLPFATDVAANVIDQATYAALATRSAGFSSGVAQSDQLNKVWRQSSVMASVLAQFVVDLSGNDVLDDGTASTIVANLKAAVSAQSTAVVGSIRNAGMNVTTASATATFTADQLVVKSALSGMGYVLSAVSLPINIAAVGAGGMDIGLAPASGFVALYAIYNPTSGTSAMLGVNATSVVAPEVYGGVNMPNGYTASALVSVAPTNPSRQFAQHSLSGRHVTTPPITVLVATTTQETYTSFPVSAGVPKNGKSVDLGLSISNNTQGASMTLSVAADAAGSGFVTASAYLATANTGVPASGRVYLNTPQTLYNRRDNNIGAPTYNVLTTGYDF